MSYEPSSRTATLLRRLAAALVVAATATSFSVSLADEPPGGGGSCDPQIGDTKSIVGVAIASDSNMVYAALMREEGESLDELHERLDGIVGRVMRGEIEPINEVPDGRLYVGRKRREKGSG